MIAFLDDLEAGVVKIDGFSNQNLKEIALMLIQAKSGGLPSIDFKDKKDP